MTDSMLPIIRQLHNAEGNRQRARVLLAMPDTVILKYSGTISSACRKAGFQAGEEYVLRRVVIMRAVRGADGRLPRPVEAEFEEFREAMAAFASAEGADHG